MLQLADKSTVALEERIEDLLIKVGKFIIPVDFIILDFKVDDKVPLILGRPFLATGASIINVKAGTLKMRVDDKEELFRVYQEINLPTHYRDICKINVLSDAKCGVVDFMGPLPQEMIIFQPESDGRLKLKKKLEEERDKAEVVPSKNKNKKKEDGSRKRTLV